jgi:hypothetical protein
VNRDEAIEHLQNILAAVNPDLPARVRATRERVLGEVISRGREIDAAAINLLASAFQELIQDTAQRALAEAKRVFSLVGMPTDELTKAHVKGIVWGQACTVIGEAERSLSQLLIGHPGVPIARSLGDSVKHFEKLSESEIDLLFEAARNSANSQRFFSSGQWFDANTTLRGIFESAQVSIDIIDPYIGHRLFVLLTAKQPTVNVRFILEQSLKPADQQSLEDFRLQYPSTRVRRLTSTLHDRFIIIDSTDAYSAGHSLKDLGSKDTVVTLSPDPSNLIGIFKQRLDAATDWP